MLFSGVMTALVTPFKSGVIDESSLRSLIDFQIKEGVDVLVPCGTTGEAPTLEQDEHERVIKITVEQAAGRVPVLAGAGSNSTSHAIKLARQAKNAGADGHLQITPYYNKPTQDGLYEHFKAIAAMVDLPMVLYNVPGRTAVNMLAETVSRLSLIDNIVGLKEASGDLNQIKKIILDAPKDFAVYSGDDALNVDIYVAGGKGAISVASNVAPSKVCAVWDRFSKGDIDEARRLHEDLKALNKAMFLETSPIPVKTALAMMGKIKEEFRLPLTPMSEVHKQELHAVLKQYKFI